MNTTIPGGPHAPPTRPEVDAPSLAISRDETLALGVGRSVDDLMLPSDVPGDTKMSVDPTELRQIVQGTLLPMKLLHQDMALGEAKGQDILERSMSAFEVVLV